MQTLPLDRKSSRESTHEASTPKAPARPRGDGPSAGRVREKVGPLAAFLRAGVLDRASPLAELWAPSGARLHALARRIETLGRGLLRVGVEPLAYTAGLLSRLARLLHTSRELMEMGHPSSRNEPSKHAPRATTTRKTHRLAALRRPCRRRERGRAGRARRSSLVTRNARRAPPRPGHLGVVVPR